MNWSRWFSICRPHRTRNDDEEENAIVSARTRPARDKRDSLYSQRFDPVRRDCVRWSVEWGGPGAGTNCRARARHSGARARGTSP